MLTAQRKICFAIDEDNNLSEKINDENNSKSNRGI